MLSPELNQKYKISRKDYKSGSLVGGDKHRQLAIEKAKSRNLQRQQLKDEQANSQRLEQQLTQQESTHTQEIQGMNLAHTQEIARKNQEIINAQNLLTVNNNLVIYTLPGGAYQKAFSDSLQRISIDTLGVTTTLQNVTYAKITDKLSLTQLGLDLADIDLIKKTTNLVVGNDDFSSGIRTQLEQYVQNDLQKFGLDENSKSGKLSDFLTNMARGVSESTRLLIEAKKAELKEEIKTAIENKKNELLKQQKYRKLADVLFVPEDRNDSSVLPTEEEVEANWKSFLTSLSSSMSTEIRVSFDDLLLGIQHDLESRLSNFFFQKAGVKAIGLESGEFGILKSKILKYLSSHENQVRESFVNQLRIEPLIKQVAESIRNNGLITIENTSLKKLSDEDSRDTLNDIIGPATNNFYDCLGIREYDKNDSKEITRRLNNTNTKFEFSLSNGFWGKVFNGLLSVSDHQITTLVDQTSNSYNKREIIGKLKTFKGSDKFLSLVENEETVKLEDLFVQKIKEKFEQDPSYKQVLAKIQTMRNVLGNSDTKYQYDKLLEAKEHYKGRAISGTNLFDEEDNFWQIFQDQKVSNSDLTVEDFLVQRCNERGLKYVNSDPNQGFESSDSIYEFIQEYGTREFWGKIDDTIKIDDKNLSKVGFFKAIKDIFETKLELIKYSGTKSSFYEALSDSKLTPQKRTENIKIFRDYFELHKPANLPSNSAYGLIKVILDSYLKNDLSIDKLVDLVRELNQILLQHAKSFEESLITDKQQITTTVINNYDQKGKFGELSIYGLKPNSIFDSEILLRSLIGSPQFLLLRGGKPISHVVEIPSTNELSEVSIVSNLDSSTTKSALAVYNEVLNSFKVAVDDELSKLTVPEFAQDIKTTVSTNFPWLFVPNSNEKVLDIAGATVSIDDICLEIANLSLDQNHKLGNQFLLKSNQDVLLLVRQNYKKFSSESLASKVIDAYNQTTIKDYLDLKSRVELSNKITKLLEIAEGCKEPKVEIQNLGKSSSDIFGATISLTIAKFFEDRKIDDTDDQKSKLVEFILGDSAGSRNVDFLKLSLSQCGDLADALQRTFTQTKEALGEYNKTKKDLEHRITNIELDIKDTSKPAEIIQQAQPKKFWNIQAPNRKNTQTITPASEPKNTNLRPLESEKTQLENQLNNLKINLLPTWESVGGVKEGYENLTNPGVYVELLKKLRTCNEITPDEIANIEEIFRVNPSLANYKSINIINITDSASAQEVLDSLWVELMTLVVENNTNLRVHTFIINLLKMKNPNVGSYANLAQLINSNQNIKSLTQIINKLLKIQITNNYV